MRRDRAAAVEISEPFTGFKELRVPGMMELNQIIEREFDFEVHFQKKEAKSKKTT